jgi:nucleotide-binding universal stress UspA family protein
MATAVEGPLVADRAWDALETALSPHPENRPVRILFATDGSADADHAVQFLRLLPLPVGSAIQVLTVTGAGDWSSPEWIQETERSWGRKVTGHAVNGLTSPTIEVSASVRSGAKAYEIIQAGEEFNADLIVVGSKGLTGIEGFLLGSVARNVAKHARRPVLVARAPVHGLRTVVLGVDESKHGPAAVRFTTGLPLPAETEVVVAHVVRPYAPAVPADMFYPTEFDATVLQVRMQQRAEATSLVRKAAAHFEASGRRVSEVTREGDPADQLLELAGERQADLIVVGARGISPIQGLLVGSVADRLLKTARCSVLLVH